MRDLDKYSTLAMLQLSDSDLTDSAIRRFVNDVASRKAEGCWFQYWNGNGFVELNKNDGTLITTVLKDEEFKPVFPLNCDMNISLKCINGCPFCYEGCSKEGKHADIKKFINDPNSFLYTLHEGTELALNGNEPLHPDLNKLLAFCKDRHVIANLTVNEKTLLKHRRQLEKFLDKRLINGIGVSPTTYSDEMIEFVQNHPTAVVHTIAGITTSEQYRLMMDKNIKILILGYKDFGRGVAYYQAMHSDVLDNINWLKENAKELPKHFRVVSFDNLAITQVNPKSFLTNNQWEKFYRGDDGHHTLYIDLVNETFAKNSIQARSNHTPIMSDIRDMLKAVQIKGE